MSGDDRIDAKIAADIAERGWSWIWVFDEGDVVSPFAYTVGLGRSFGHADFAIAGLPQEVAIDIITDLCSRVSSGEQFQSGERDNEVLEGVDVEFCKIDKESSLAGVGRSIRRPDNKGMGVLQVLWPDRDGHYPTDASAPDWLRERQEIVG